jgi:hypothetical protein
MLTQFQYKSLLNVFLPEIGVIRLYSVEKLGTDGSDTSEELSYAEDQA